MRDESCWINTPASFQLGRPIDSKGRSPCSLRATHPARVAVQLTTAFSFYWISSFPSFSQSLTILLGIISQINYVHMQPHLWICLGRIRTKTIGIFFFNFLSCDHLSPGLHSIPSPLGNTQRSARSEDKETSYNVLYSSQ